MGSREIPAGPAHRITTDAVLCPGCKRELALRSPLPKEGWQVFHSCPTATIEVFVAEPGERPMAWRSMGTASA